ncbi:hypothetical protein KI387_042189, partial [Taxus chinensis]
VPQATFIACNSTSAPPAPAPTSSVATPSLFSSLCYVLSSCHVTTHMSGRKRSSNMSWINFFTHPLSMRPFLPARVCVSRFQEITGSNPQHKDKAIVQRDLEGDCPMCYEPLAGGREVVVFCMICGNNVHIDYFVKWSQSKHSGTMTCIYCRAPWEGQNKESKNNKGYVNLVAYSDLHRPKETSLEVLYPYTST